MLGQPVKAVVVHPGGRDTPIVVPRRKERRGREIVAPTAPIAGKLPEVVR